MLVSTAERARTPATVEPAVTGRFRAQAYRSSKPVIVVSSASYQAPASDSVDWH